MQIPPALLMVVFLVTTVNPQERPCEPSREPFPTVGRENDVDQLWTPLPGAGYLAFKPYPDKIRFGPITPVCGSIPLTVNYLDTEEDTGWSNPDGVGSSDFHPPLKVDSHDWAGNRVDFDWVRENRDWEASNTGLHPMDHGLLAFVILDSPQHSPHDSHDHGKLGEVILKEFTDKHFNRVDVFSIALLRPDGADLQVETDSGLSGENRERAAVLDYDLWFVDLQTKTSTHGEPELVFVPGWNQQTWFDDFVTRWRPSSIGDWNAVAIEPHKGDGRDGSCEIDGVIAAQVP